MPMRKKHKKKWTSKEFYRLWGILALVSMVLCLVMVVFFVTGRESGLVFKMKGTRYVQEDSSGFPLYLYAAIFFGGLVVINLILMALTKLYAQYHKSPKSTVVLKPRRR